MADLDPWQEIDVKTVTLYGKHSADRVALVDDEDYDLVMQHRWRVREPRVTPSGARTAGGPYAVASGPRKTTIYMHRLLVDYPVVDHIDGNGLNNQRHNMRAATHSQNHGNWLRSYPRGTSRFRGVSWNRKMNAWVAVIGIDRKLHWLGSFSDEEAAARAYDAAALAAWGEFAHPNFPDDLAA